MLISSKRWNFSSSQLAPPLHLAVHGKTPCTLISPDHRKVSHLWSPVFCCAPRQVLWSGARGGREVWGSICWSRWDCHPDVGLNPITSIILRFGNGTALILMFCPTNQFIIFSQTYHSLQLANQVHKPDCTLCTSQKVPKILEKGTRRYQYTHTFLHCIS